MKRFFARYGRYLLFAVAYPVVGGWLFDCASVYWFPPAGWRFIAYLLLPPRWWWLPIVTSLLYWHSLWPDAGIVVFREILREALFVVPILWLKRGDAGFGIQRMHDLWRLLGAMLLSGISGAVLFLNAWFPTQLGVDLTGMSKLSLFVQFVSGDFNGMLLLVPLLLMLAKQRPNGQILRRWRFDVPCVLLPALALYMLAAFNADVQIYVFATVLCILPLMYFAFRSGWRGVAIAFSLASITVALCARGIGGDASPVLAQLLLGVSGAGALLLGSANDALRERQHELGEQNRKLLELSEQLRQTARRNLTQAEDLRRWITSEVHDELGQNLAALQMQIKLAENNTGQLRAFVPIREIVGSMRKSVSGLLNSLRPAGLDEFGLYRILHEGGIRQLLQVADIDYRLRISGDVEALETLADEAQISLYRIVQETATNALRHARARRFVVQLRVCRRGHAVHVALRCADDGNGIDESRRRAGGIGLHGIEDRVHSFGGRFHLRSNRRGTRVLVLIAFS